MATARKLSTYPAPIIGRSWPSSERSKRTAGSRLRTEKLNAPRRSDRLPRLCVSTARDPIFHKKAKAAALRDLQLLRKPVGARSRKRSTRKIPKMMAPAECPIMLTSCDSSMPDIDQLESIPIGTMRPPQNLTPDKPMRARYFRYPFGAHRTEGSASWSADVLYQ